MNRWAWVVLLLLGACTTTVHGKGHSWGIEGPQEVNALLADANLSAGLYSTPEQFTLIGGKRVSTEIHALLDTYKRSKHVAFKDFPHSKSYEERFVPSQEIVTFRARRGSYLDLVVEKEKEETRVLRLFRTSASDQYATVVVLREFDRKRDAWMQVDEALVTNSSAIVGAWTNLESALQRESAKVEYPVWANRAPGSSRLPFHVNLPPYSYFPEIN